MTVLTASPPKKIWHREQTRQNLTPSAVGPPMRPAPAFSKGSSRPCSRTRERSGLSQDLAHPIGERVWTERLRDEREP
jgi:hypothetical protein